VASHVTEAIVSVEPFVVVRQVKWQDCDPAGVVYTGQMVEYVLSAAIDFVNAVARLPQAQPDEEAPVGFPARGLEASFESSLRPGDDIRLTVSVGDVRDRSFDLTVVGVSQERRVVRARVSPIVVDARTRGSRLIDATLRERLLRHRPQTATQDPLTSIGRTL
jgi:acyl-CoA thioesterase FadM